MFQVRVTSEVLLYNFQNFVADFGGYLGLLLGSSIPAIYEALIEVTSYFFTKKP